MSIALILYLPTTDTQVLGVSAPALEESGRTKTWASKAPHTLEMGFFLPVCFSFLSVSSLHTACFSHYWNYLTITFLQNLFLGYKSRKALKDNSSVPPRPTLGFSCA